MISRPPIGVGGIDAWRRRKAQETAMAKKPAKKPDKTEKKYPDTKYPPRKRKPKR